MGDNGRVEWVGSSIQNIPVALLLKIMLQCEPGIVISGPHQIARSDSDGDREHRQKRDRAVSSYFRSCRKFEESPGASVSLSNRSISGWAEFLIPQPHWESNGSCGDAHSHPAVLGDQLDIVKTCDDYSHGTEKQGIGDSTPVR